MYLHLCVVILIFKVFEYDENGMVDETKCLKAYQRSAADQEESLPNELRPATTLVDCCWYLCAELCTEENIYRNELKYL